MTSSSTDGCSGIKDGSKQYPYPSHVNVANFLSIKLSGVTNYRQWQEQIKCLLDSHDMVSFIEPKLKKPPKNNDSKEKADESNMDANYREWKRSDSLVKGWIFGSLSEHVMDAVVGLDTAYNVWNELNRICSTLNPNPTTTITSHEVWTKYRPLYEAILVGDWKKAQDIFNSDPKALTVKFNDNHDSALHVAISTCNNVNVVENILKKIESKELLNDLLTGRVKMNPLHRAAIVGNTEAAQKLVEKNPRLLFTIDKLGLCPIHRAIYGAHKETFLYLLRVTKENIRLYEERPIHERPFEGKKCGVLLVNIIGNGLMDVAYDLIKKYPCMAIMKDGKSIPLKAMAGKLDTYFSGAQYNFYQRFVYSSIAANIFQPRTSELLEDVHVQEDNVHSDNANKIQDLEKQDTNKVKFDAKCGRSCFQPVIQMINYVKFWKIALLHVTQIKHLQEEKLKHNKSLMVLKCICEEVSKIEEVDKIREHYYEAIALALENDNPEGIEEIIRTFPQAIWTVHNHYRITQFAIVNRCEKVYNFLVHHMVVTDKHTHKVWVDKDGNNMLHLAGLLSPIKKLNRVSGAALQMQRELQWFEEVKTVALQRNNKTKNKNNETPMAVFRREHKELRKEGEEWMKKTADSYTITAALIITIVFAAAITVPGGNDGNTGKAIFANKYSFIVFAVSDAISLFASTTSLLLFLSILTARYRDKDFLYRLPKRLILGLAMLFLSVTSMMVAFSATLYIMFGQEKKWILIPIAALTCLPIASFVTLQLPLLLDLISSTYGEGIFGKERNRFRIK